MDHDVTGLNGNAAVQNDKVMRKRRMKEIIIKIKQLMTMISKMTPS